MIYTVTLNPAIDKTVVIDRFAPGKVNRISTLRTDPGGKGINVSKCLKQLGTESVAAVLLAGASGDQLEVMLNSTGIQTLSVRIPGTTRTNLKIVDPVLGQNTDINEPGPAVPPEKLEELKEKILCKLNADDLVILSGSLPTGTGPELYREWIRAFRDAGARVFLDADGNALSLGIEASPWLVKPNDEELARLMRAEKLCQPQILYAARKLLARGIHQVVVSLGAEGAIFVSPEGAWQARGLKVPVRSTVGAGDAMVAAMAHGIQSGLDREEQIRLAMAMGAASVMEDGTQAPDPETVRALAVKVEITAL